MRQHAYDSAADDALYFDPAPLADIGDPDTEAYLIELFLDQAATRLPELADAIAAGDGEALRRLADGLKGSAATVGAVHLAELCEALCQVAGICGPDAVAIQERLRQALTETSAAMHEHRLTLTDDSEPERL